MTETPIPGFIRNAQKRAAAAAKARPTETPQAPSARTAATLVKDGWDYEDRLGRRIWSHEEVNGGAFYGEDMAVRINDERKGS